MAKEGPRKKLPKELAVINADNCTGCEALLGSLPPSTASTREVQQYDNMHNLQSWCQIDYRTPAWAAKCACIFRRRRRTRTS